jgi:hypothetical protein
VTGAAWLSTFSAFLKLFPEFLAASWRGWRSIAAALFGETPEDVAFLHRATGRTVFPDRVLAFFAAFGRGTGKTRFAVAMLATYFAVGRVYRLAPGEQVFIEIVSPTKKQSGIAFRYIVGLLKSVPTFGAMIVRETSDSVELSNGVVIETGTPDYRSIRGRSVVLAVIDEGSFLPTDDSATPDTELLRALRPALARVPGSLLIFVSSPYSQKGELFRAFQKHWGKNDSDTLVMRASTAELNPLFDARAIEEAYADDPVSAASEYGAEFRKDIESYLSPDAITAVTVPGRFELPPDGRFRYTAFLDFAGGAPGGDSATLAIAHRDPVTGGAVLDVVREVIPPFSPDDVCGEFASACRAYGVREAVSDRWAGSFPSERMGKLGVRMSASDRSKSDLYRDLLPLVMSGRVELLDMPRLASQLAGLERRVARGGKDSIDHAPGGRDDVANAVAGALVLAVHAQTGPAIAVIAANKTTSGTYRGQNHAEGLLQRIKTARLARDMAHTGETDLWKQ